MTGTVSRGIRCPIFKEGDDLAKIIPDAKESLLGVPEYTAVAGYSLAGLFALWASCQTNAFSACMAASPSVWFPGWIDYQAEHPQQTDIIYLSLGDKEERARNPLMSQVGNCIRRQAALMAGKTTVQ